MDDCLEEMIRNVGEDQCVRVCVFVILSNLILSNHFIHDALLLQDC